MKKKDNFPAINEMRKMLGTTKKLVLENFIMPEEDETDEYGDTSAEERVPEQPRQKSEVVDDVPQYSKEVKSAIVEIRKIAIGVIAQLANEVNSNSYQYMKKVLDMSDKALAEMSGNGQEKQG